MTSESIINKEKNNELSQTLHQKTVSVLRTRLLTCPCPPPHES